MFANLAWANVVPFREFNINNGLPHTDAYCTVQDNKGFLWFATLNGLCRYDGVEMLVFRNDHADPFSIGNNRITALEFDNDRNGLWIGTQRGGLNFLDVVSGKFHRIDIQGEAQPALEILSIKIIGQENLWVGTQHGLFAAHLDESTPDKLRFRPVSLGKAGMVESIHQDINKGIWVGTLEELYYKPPGKGAFNPLHPGELRGVYSVTAYDESHVLVGTVIGLFIIDLESFSLTKLNDLQVTSLLVDKPNSIWVGTASSGLFNCDGDGRVRESHAFDQTGESHKYKVSHIYKDRSSSLFVSTLGGGIKVINKNSHTFKTYPLNVTEKEFSRLKHPLCFYADDNSTLFIGIRNNSFAVYDRINNEVEFHQLPDNGPGSGQSRNITAIFKDEDKNLWLGTGEGIHILNITKSSHNTTGHELVQFLPSPFSYCRINKIVQDSRHRVWVVTSKGLLCYRKNGRLVYNSKWNPEEYKDLNGAYLNDIVLREEDEGSVLVVWLATKSGIVRLKLNNRNFDVIESKRLVAGTGDSQLHSNWISLLHVDQEAHLWAGTIGGGLSRIVEENGAFTFKTITTKDGLLTNDVETLLEDSEGNFWIGGIGLTKYNPIKKSFAYYDANDGLQSNAFKVWAAFKSPDGEMIFGGINGFNIFYPQNIRKEITVFTPQLTNLVINNITVNPGTRIEDKVILEKTLPYTSEITLNHKIRNFGLEFASIHSHDFDKIVYKYRLLGYDAQWTYTNSQKRFVNYTGLPAGDYTFELYASGGEGVWDSRPLLLEIHVIPSFWKSTYGYLLYFFLILAALFLLRRYTLIRLHNKHRIQLDKTRQEQEIRAYEDKVEFFTNLSHEFRTPLTLITTPIEQLVRHPDLPAAVSSKLSIVHKNAERLRNLIDQILDMRKLELGKIKLNKEAVNIAHFLEDLHVQFEELAARKDIAFILDVSVDDKVLIDVFKMEQALINLLSNAIKFTPPDGEITLRCIDGSKEVTIEVTNTGSTLSDQEQSKVFEPFYQVENASRQGTGLGLAITKHLVELHNGTIAVNSGLDKQSGLCRTSFVVKIPRSSEVANVGEAYESTPRVRHGINEPERVEKVESVLVIVDDNREFTKILEEEFAPRYKVYTAANGRDGLKLIRKTKPVLVITDVMMPELDGIDLCKAVKNDVATNDIPVIMLTARSAEHSRLTGLEAMADDYIAKPFNLRELHLKVENAVRHRANLRVRLHNDVALRPSALTFEGKNERLLKNVVQIIEHNIDNPEFSVEQLCKIAAISRPVLYRRLRELTGMSIQQFILDIRLKRAAQLLVTKCFSVSEVMHKTGFSSASYFNKAFKNKYHTNPVGYSGTVVA